MTYATLKNLEHILALIDRTKAANIAVVSFNRGDLHAYDTTPKDEIIELVAFALECKGYTVDRYFDRVHNRIDTVVITL